MGDFDAKVVLVTGGAGGIGAAASGLFAGRGASVVVADRDVAGAAATAAAIRATGGIAVEHEVDVGDVDSVAALVDAVVATYGRLDCAFNNAGISPGVSAFTDVAADDWQRVIAINLSGVFWCMQAELRQLVEQGGGGVIVNTSSGAGVVCRAGSARVHRGEARCARPHEGRGAGVRPLRDPGERDPAGNDRHPDAAQVHRREPRDGEAHADDDGDGRVRPAEKVAEAAVWLCSDAASFVSGESMLVDGGQVCR